MIEKLKHDIRNFKVLNESQLAALFDLTDKVFPPSSEKSIGFPRSAV